MQVKLQYDSAHKGRTVVLLTTKEAGLKISQLVESLSEFRIIQIELSPDAAAISLLGEHWREECYQFSASLQSEYKIRQAHIIGVGSAACVAQGLTLLTPKLVRSLVLINATSRSNPTTFEKIIDRLERFLPLGLPFRTSSDRFHSTALLQRIRCPALVIESSTASLFESNEAAVFSKKIPTAWYYKGEEIAAEIKSFFELPAKRPQKGV